MIEVIRLEGQVPYLEALELQRARVKEVQQGHAPNTLYLLEHAPVITLGRNAHAEHLLLRPEQLREQGIAVETADRGGDVTYHGPGQLVAYPILDLHQWKLSVGWYLRTLEQVLIDLLAEYALPGERVEGMTGVWCRGAKVAAIGVGVNRWVTYHGIALNVNPDMAHFGLIVPCGIQDKPVTSLARLLGDLPTKDQVQPQFEKAFLQAFIHS